MRRAFRILCAVFLLTGIVSIGARDSWAWGSTRQGPCLAFERYSLYFQYHGPHLSKNQEDHTGYFDLWVVKAYWEYGAGYFLSTRVNWFGLSLVCLALSFLPSRRKQQSAFPLDSAVASFVSKSR